MNKVGKLSLILSVLFIICLISSIISYSKETDSYRIAYVKSENLSREGQKDNIYFIDSDGSDNQVTFDGINFSPSISPDGLKVVFIKEVGNTTGNIYIMDYNGSNVKKLTSSGKCYNPAFSPDGKKIVFISEERAIYVMSIDGKSKNKIYELPKKEIQKNWYNNIGSVAMSSDNKFYFLENPGINTAGCGYIGKFAVVTISGNICTDIKGACRNFSISGNKIAFTYPKESGYYSILTDIIPADLTSCSSDFSGDTAYNLSLSYDGEKIVYDTLGGFRERDYQESNIFMRDYYGGGKIQFTYDNKSWYPSISGKI